MRAPLLAFQIVGVSALVVDEIQAAEPIFRQSLTDLFVAFSLVFYCLEFDPIKIVVGLSTFLYSLVSRRIIF